MARAHSLAYRNLPSVFLSAGADVELVRLADVTPELARAGAERLGWREGVADWRKITRAEDIDVVDIVAPNHVHAEVAIDAARHGKHVLCEKPLAPDAASARAMVDAVSDAGVVNQVGFVYRQWPAVEFAKRLLVAGRIGRVLHFRAHYFHDYALDPEVPATWRFQRAKGGAGSIGDIGSHLIDIARYLVDDVERLVARSRTFIEERPRSDDHGQTRFRRDGVPGPRARVDVDDAMDMLVEFAGGATGTIQTNWSAAGHNNDLGFELSGERGAIDFSWPRANELRLMTMDEEEELRGYRTIVMGPVHPKTDSFWPVAGLGLGYSDAFLVSLHEGIDAIARGRPASPSFLDGLRAVEVVEAAQRSAASDGWVEVARWTAAPPLRPDGRDRQVRSNFGRAAS